MTTAEMMIQDANLVSEIRDLCIKNDYFTCGSNEQYNKMFEFAKVTKNHLEVAQMIWLCSDCDNPDMIAYVDDQLMEIWDNLGIPL